MSHYNFTPSDRAITERLDTIIKQQKEIIALLRERMGKAEKQSHAIGPYLSADGVTYASRMEPDE